MLDAQRPAHDIGILQILVRRLNRAEAVSSTLQQTRVAGAGINIAAIDTRILVPVELSGQRRLHAARNCRRW